MTEEPLTEEEQEIILRYAKEYDKEVGGWGGISVYKTILFFMETGIHPASARPGNVKVVRSRTEQHIKWNRTKKKGIDALTIIPLPSLLDSWIDDYVKNDLLFQRQYYWDICKELREYIEKKLGDQMPEDIKQLSPRQLRHTFGCNRVCGIRGERLDPHEVKQIMNCSWKTLEYYLRRRTSMLRKW